MEVSRQASVKLFPTKKPAEEGGEEFELQRCSAQNSKLSRWDENGGFMQEGREETADSGPKSDFV